MFFSKVLINPIWNTMYIKPRTNSFSFRPYCRGFKQCDKQLYRHGIRLNVTYKHSATTTLAFVTQRTDSNTTGTHNLLEVISKIIITSSQWCRYGLLMWIINNFQILSPKLSMPYLSHVDTCIWIDSSLSLGQGKLWLSLSVRFLWQSSPPVPSSIVRKWSLWTDIRHFSSWTRQQTVDLSIWHRLGCRTTSRERTAVVEITTFAHINMTSMHVSLSIEVNTLLKIIHLKFLIILSL